MCEGRAGGREGENEVGGGRIRKPKVVRKGRRKIYGEREERVAVGKMVEEMRVRYVSGGPFEEKEKKG